MPVIAVDGGGTRCRFAVMDARGSQLAYLETATCHPGQIGLEAMGERLSAGARRVCAEADVSLADCVVSLGLAGYGPGCQRPLDQAVRQGLGDARSLLVISDAEAARLGALEGAEGLLLVAGTGSICTGVIDGAWVRAGGWGFMLGDEGSGAWLGKAAASYVLRAADGGAEKDQPLEDRLCEALDIQKPQDLVERLAQAADARRLLGTLAPVVMGLASEGDRAAGSLVEQAACQLASLVSGCLRQAEPQQSVACSYTGGLFSAGALLLEPLKARLDKRVRLVAPRHSPLYGAWLNARMTLGELAL